MLTARDPNVKFSTEMSRMKVQQAKYAELSHNVPLSSVFGQLHGCSIGTINISVALLTMLTAAACEEESSKTRD